MPNDDDELSIDCIAQDVQLVTLKVAVDVQNHPLAQLPPGTVLYLLERLPDGRCRVTQSPQSEPFLVSTSKLNFRLSREDFSPKTSLH